MAEEKPDQPKIIVDDDWKAQAQAEKERLEKEVARPADMASSGQTTGEVAGDAGDAGEAGGEAGPRRLPPASFATLVSSLVAQTFMTLGGMEDPKTKQRFVDLDLARHHIDTLSVLEEKTKGNLSEQESKLLDQALYETRMQYVQIAQRATKAT